MRANSLSAQVPATTLAACVALTSAGLAPSDPRILTVVLVQSCMPAAQNLVLLANVGPDASRAAPAVSRLLLWQYAIAAVPVALWMSVFGAAGLLGGVGG